jgi:DnaJ-class molecular chaperone
MTYTEEGISMTHEEAIGWLEWYRGRMLAQGTKAARVREFCHDVAQWLGSGGAYLSGDELCHLCEGTGKSRLLIAGTSNACHRCQGTGREPRDAG